MSNELKCWSCKAVFTLSEHADCDGCCWKCGVEIDLDEMDIPAAPQPPALGGEPEVLGYFYKGDTMGDQFNKLCLKHYYRKPGADEHDYIQPLALIDRAHLAPLQAEIERHKANAEEWEKASLHWMAERDQLKARRDELHRMLGLAWGSGDVSAEDCRKIDAALSKPAGSEQ